MLLWEEGVPDMWDLKTEDLLFRAWRCCKSQVWKTGIEVTGSVEFFKIADPSCSIFVQDWADAAVERETTRVVDISRWRQTL